LVDEKKENEEIEKPEIFDEPSPLPASEAEIAQANPQKKSASNIIKTGEPMDIKKIGGICLAISLVVVLAMGQLGLGGWVTKKDFETNLANVTKTITQTTASINENKVAVDKAVSGIPATIQNAVQAALNTTVSSVNTQLTEIGNKVNNFNSTLTGKIDGVSAKMETANSNIATATQKITDLTAQNTELKKNIVDLANKSDALTAQVTTLNTKVTDYETRIKALETKATPVSTPNAVTATVKTISNSLVATSNTTMAGSIRVLITNNTASAVSDIVLDVGIQTGVITGYTAASLSGGSTIWQGQGIPWNMIDFVNTQWGLNLAANESKTIYLTFTVTGTGFIPQYETYGVPFQVDVTVL
jgi:phage shock protein A